MAKIIIRSKLASGKVKIVNSRMRRKMKRIAVPRKMTKVHPKSVGVAMEKMIQRVEVKGVTATKQRMKMIKKSIQIN